MSTHGSPSRDMSDHENEYEATPPRSPRFMPISADCTERIELSEESDPSGDESEPIEEESEITDTVSRRVRARKWNWVPGQIQSWEEEEEIPSIPEIGKSSTVAPIAPLTQEPAHHTDPVLVARITQLECRLYQLENPGRNSGQQQPGKRQETVEAHAAEPNIRKPYAGSRPYCNKCTLHHTGPCGNSCHRCKRLGHQAKDCTSPAPVASYSGQQQRKRRKTVKTYIAGPDVKKGYMGKKPHCNKCNRHHTGPCGTPCGKCTKYGHQAKDCGNPAPNANTGAPKTCFECGGTGHFKKNCPNLWNHNNNNNNARGIDV